LLIAIDGLLLLHCHAGLPADSIDVVPLHFTSLKIDFVTLDLDAACSLNFFFLAFKKPSDCAKCGTSLPIVPSLTSRQSSRSSFIRRPMSSDHPSFPTHHVPLCCAHAPTCHNHQSMPTTPIPQFLPVIAPAVRHARLRPRPSRT
jgi:hypothetical protein